MRVSGVRCSDGAGTIMARAKGATGAASGGGGLHTEREDHPWTIQIPDHPQRTDSPTYVISRKLMNAICKEAGKPADGVMGEFFFGAETDFQDHHGGGLWVKDAKGWFLLKNLAGMEWSQQFCADPAKVDYLRQIAQRLYAAFPLALPAMKALLSAADLANYPIDDILKNAIKTEDDVSRWVDSIFNASVPLYPARHTGVLQPDGHAGDSAPQIEGGVHHYPTPITDIQLFKHDDFQLWVMDSEGEVAAVTPAGARGSGDGRVNVAYATPGTQLHSRWMRTHLNGQHLTLPADHSLAKQAFAAQQARPAAAAE
jgi:hypothetical protein